MGPPGRALQIRRVVPAYHLKNALGTSEIMTSSSFFLAVNYPWLDYGCDFGRSPWGYSGLASPHARDVVAADFARIRSSGVSVVRWFLLCDGRSGVRYENGIPAGPDDFLFTDVAAALDLASRSSLQICFSLFDFLWLQTPDAPRPTFPGRAALQFAGGREALLQKILLPLFREFCAHPALFAWEIVNEPEWAIPEFQPSQRASLSLAKMRVLIFLKSRKPFAKKRAYLSLSAPRVSNGFVHGAKLVSTFCKRIIIRSRSATRNFRSRNSSARFRILHSRSGSANFPRTILHRRNIR